MSDSAEGLEFFKPDFSRRVVPAPIVYKPESEISSGVSTTGRPSTRSDGLGIRTRVSRSNKKSRRNDLPAVRTDEDSQTDLLDRVTKFLPGWMLSFLLHLLLLSTLATFVSAPKPQPIALIASITTADERDIADELSVDFAVAQDDALTIDEIEVDEPVDVHLGELLDPDIGLDDENDSKLSSITDKRSSDAFAAVDVVESGKSKGSGQGSPGKKGTSFFGIESKGNRFVYIVDCSGSMFEEDRYQRAIYELHRSLMKLDEDQEFLVAIYNDRIFPMLDRRLNETKLIKASVNNRASVIRWMRAQVPFGFTLPAPAMYGALKVKPDAIFLLSDGELGDDTVGMLRKFNLGSKSAGNPKIPINTITLGSTGAGLPTMKRIAQENEGQFIWVK